MGFEDAALSTALKLNQNKWVFTPLYVVYLCHLKPEKNKKDFNLPKLNECATATEQLKFAGGILINLWPDLQDQVLNFLPLMNARRKKWILNLAQKNLQAHKIGHI